MKKTDDPVIVEQIFNSSIDKVWNAITELNQMTQWFFENIPSFKPEVGFETRFDVHVKDKKFPHLWKITEVVPMKKITYNWRYEGYLGNAYVTFELFELNDQTKLKLTYKVVVSFSEDIPEFSRKMAIEGWSYFIKASLKEYLDKLQEIRVRQQTK